MRHRRPTRWSRVRVSAREWRRQTLLHWRRSLLRLVVAASLVIGFGAAISWDPGIRASPNATPIPQSPVSVADDVWASRGQVVSQQPYEPPVELGDVPGDAWRATYASVSGVDGARRDVTGAFFVPRGDPPPGGWPVISFAHGTTGIGNDCGPTWQPNFQGYLPVVVGLMDHGYAVALTDYEGLGDVGTHPYLEPQTAAFNVVDAVRALRNISPTVSARWVALGFSQGGQASWAANELNPYYGQDLELLGSIAVAPAANVSGVAQMAWQRALTEDQLELYPLLITGLARYTPDFDEHAFLHGTLEVRPAWLDRCAPESEAPKRSAPMPTQWMPFDLAVSDDRRPATPADVDELRTALRRIALPQRALSAPMLVFAGGRDILVLPEWVTSAVAESCALGGQIEFLEFSEADHETVIWQAGQSMLAWLTDRFDGIPAPSNCPNVQ